MDNWTKIHEEMLATLKRIESSKDLAQFFENIPDLSIKKYLKDCMSDHPDDVKDGE